MIHSFKDQRTEDLFHGTSSKRVKKLDNKLVRAAVRKLDMLNAAHRLEDLKSPPGNRLEALRGERLPSLDAFIADCQRKARDLGWDRVCTTSVGRERSEGG